MFGLIDCNNFFVSCERAFRPDLTGKPVVVLSNNDGCVIARSEEVKKLGIEMGTPFYQIESLIKKYGIAVFSSNYTLYVDMSARVMMTLRDFVDELEVYSVDEAFLNLASYERLDVRKYGKKIVDTIKQNTGIPASLGIAPTKTLAKIASKFAKKYKRYEGVCIIKTDEQRLKALKLFDVGDIWGVGDKYKTMLNQNGVFTAFDFIQKPSAWVCRKMTINGLRTWKELHGIPCVDLEEGKAKKSICTSRTFGSLVTAYSILTEAVSEFTANCARKLRQQNTAAGTITVFVHTNPFRENNVQFYASRRINLEVATNSSSELIKAALQILKEMYQPGYELSKAGVIVSSIVPVNQVQGSLFDRVDRKRLNQVDAVIDKINHLYGSNTLKVASQGFSKKWELKNRYLSRCYTTRLDEIIEIK